MQRRNCHCGIVAHANCTRCGNGVCSNHFANESSHLGSDIGFSLGKTLAEAAHMKGFRKASREPYVCKNCRNADGRQHQLHVARLSRRWLNTPFAQAIQAAAAGYVITEPSITYDQAVAAWIALGRPLEDLAVRRLVRPERFKQGKRMPRGSGSMIPAEYAIDRYRGWAFPGTISVFSGQYQYHTDSEIWHWAGTTYILPNGHRLIEPTNASEPISPAKLLVEMARKLCADGSIPWHGPQRGWSN